ncbi:transposable element Tcb2 transposase [Trichonephila clavipes]|uniref:Transposable element Tcb2 transposase n=1 Tax=Trichonephila clavipes TaxID=2585209 RepID=A0A8X7B8M5_TRICX|nr:transposable element Tcb2 transposase [Trichonephila clavipes]
MLGPVAQRNVIYTKTSLRMPLTDQSLRRPTHPKKCTRTANCFIGRPPSRHSGTAHEETGQQRNGTRSSLVTNPDSISAVMAIVFVCGDPVGERLNPVFALQRQTALSAGVMEPFFNKTKLGLTRHKTRTVTTLPWPAPDSSPIEHIWDHLGRRVGNPTSLNELEQRFSNVGCAPLRSVIILHGGASISKSRI